MGRAQHDQIIALHERQQVGTFSLPITPQEEIRHIYVKTILSDEHILCQ